MGRSHRGWLSVEHPIGSYFLDGALFAFVRAPSLDDICTAVGLEEVTAVDLGRVDPVDWPIAYDWPLTGRSLVLRCDDACTVVVDDSIPSDGVYRLARDREVDELVCVFWNIEMNGEFSHWVGGDLVSRVDPYDAALNLDLDDPYQDPGPGRPVEEDFIEQARVMTGCDMRPPAFARTGVVGTRTRPTPSSAWAE